MKIARRFTTLHKDPYEEIPFESRVVEIVDEDGSRVFRKDGITVPSFWSQTATDILAAKFLWRGGAGKPAETDVRQAINRLAKAWRHWGEKLGVFSTSEDAQSYEDEIRFMLVHQMASPNSPQWFNTGVALSYGAKGPKQGHYYVDSTTGKAQAAENSYEHPQAHACFIQSVKDDLVNENGIMDLWLREARLFKFGSGSGTNFSQLRGEREPLAGGGVSSGLLSFLKIGDAAAGAIRSGGTTRRAAKMVCVDADHPDIEAFIDWKVREERKVAAMVSGNEALRLHLPRVWKACFASPKVDTNPAGNPTLRTALDAARAAFIPESLLQQTLQSAARGIAVPEFEKLDTDWRHEAYQSVSGQNSNNSVRVSQDFLHAEEKGEDWNLKYRNDGKTAKTLSARGLWKKIAAAAWECADPGLQFDTTINEWHTCPAGGRIQASNPCSEYLFLDDTGCNLASLNLVKFVDSKTGEFQVENFRQAVRLWTLTLEISVGMAGYPSRAIAERSFQYRTLGLGYANLGSLLMLLGIPYDSEQALGIVGGITALLSGEAYAVSAEIAAEKGSFAKYSENQEAMLRVIRNHRRAAYGEKDFEGISVAPQPLASSCPKALAEAAKKAWDRALLLGEKQGFRNAQVSAIAPTGTIGLVMDCDTMGIEPEFALVKYKKLAGGGLLRIVNQTFSRALERLGYSENAIEKIETHLAQKNVLLGAPELKKEHQAIFDCANRTTPDSRVLSSEAHLKAVAAAQSFVSGGVSKTINLPEEVSVDEVMKVHERAWKLGLKAIAIYRAGCKLSQPLGSQIDNNDPSCVECG